MVLYSFLPKFNLCEDFHLAKNKFGLFPPNVKVYVLDLSVLFLGEKRDPSENYANSNLRNLTHITQKPSYVYTFFTYTLKEITALRRIKISLLIRSPRSVPPLFRCMIPYTIK